MSVRAKLQLTEIAENMHGGKRVRFETRYDDKIPEDQRFYDATPWGTFETIINNPAALDQLKLGECYYLDLTPVPAT